MARRRWTRWRRLSECRDESYTGVACYELSVAGVRGGNLQPVYVGKTGTLCRRMREHHEHPWDNIRKPIDLARDKGYRMYYRFFFPLENIEEAEEFESHLLRNCSCYPWNKRKKNPVFIR